MSDQQKKTTHFRSLAVTLTLAFLTLSLLVLLVSSLINVYLSFSAQQKALARQQQLVAEQAGSQVRNFIQVKLHLLETTSSVGKLAEATSDEQKGVLSKLLGLDLSIRQMVLSDGNGIPLAKASRLSSVLSEQLNQRIGSGLFSKIGQGENYISPIYIDDITNEPMTVLAIPMKDLFGNFKGGLITEVNLKFMWDLVANIKIGQGGLAYVVDRQGNLLAFHDTDRTLRSENLSALEEVASFVKRQGGSEKSFTGITGGINGTNVVAEFAPLGEPDWAVVVELPAAEAYAPIIQELFRSAAVILVSLILTIVASIFLSRRITGPLVKLSGAVGQISEGKFDTRIELTSHDEIGQLASSFNQMTDRLQLLYSGLQEKVVELRQEEARLKASINSLNVGFVITDKDRRIFLANDTAKRIICLKPDTHGTRAIHTEDVSNLECTLEDMENRFGGVFDLKGQIAKCLSEQKLIEVKSLSFGTAFFHIFMAPIVVFENQRLDVIGVVILIEDITEAKVLERSKDEFFSIASHELRTPLTAIKGNTSLIQQFYAGEIKDKDFKGMLSDIHESSTRLIEIVNDFLDMSRLEQGRMEFKNQPIDLNELIQRVLREFQVTGSRQKLNIDFDPSTKATPLAYADPDKVKQVLINLIGNSLKFTEEGGIKITLERTPKFLKVLVTDTGRGIPLKNQELLFHKFQQAGSSLLTRDATKGTGLGLYISKLIMEGMGGQINLESSREGKGSTFSFTLPQANPEQLKQASSTYGLVDTKTGLEVENKEGS